MRPAGAVGDIVKRNIGVIGGQIGRNINPPEAGNGPVQDMSGDTEFSSRPTAYTRISFPTPASTLVPKVPVTHETGDSYNPPRVSTGDSYTPPRVSVSDSRPASPAVSDYRPPPASTGDRAGPPVPTARTTGDRIPARSRTSDSRVPGHGMGDLSSGVTGLGDSAPSPPRQAASTPNSTVVTGDEGPVKTCPSCTRALKKFDCYPHSYVPCKCSKTPARQFGQVVQDDSVGMPPGCTKVHSYGSFPGLSGWLSIPDGRPGCIADGPIRAAGAAESDSSGSSGIGTALGWGAAALGAYAGYRYMRRNRRGAR